MTVMQNNAYLGRTTRAGADEAERVDGRPPRPQDRPAPTAPRGAFLVTPPHGAGRPIDATHAVIAAVAYSLWQELGGSDLDNWLAAERFVQGMLQRPGRAPGRRTGKP